MGCPRIPEEEITWLSANLYPFTAPFLQPILTLVGEAIPLRSPLWDSCLPRHLLVELLTQLVGALADNKATIIGSIGKQVDQTIQRVSTTASRFAHH